MLSNLPQMINNSFLSPLKKNNPHSTLRDADWKLKRSGLWLLERIKRSNMVFKGHRNQDDTHMPCSFHPETLKTLGLNQLCSPTSVSGTDGKQKARGRGMARNRESMGPRIICNWLHPSFELTNENREALFPVYSSYP